MSTLTENVQYKLFLTCKNTLKVKFSDNKTLFFVLSFIFCVGVLNYPNHCTAQYLTCHTVTEAWGVVILYLAMLKSRRAQSQE